MREGRTAEALSGLERAVALEPDNGAFQGALGRVLVDDLQAKRGEREAFAATLHRARTTLARAAELEPSAAHVLALLGYVERVNGTDLPRAVTALEQAARLAPAREQYRLMLAETLLAQKEYDRATSYLGPLMARGSTSDIRVSARTLLTRVAEDRGRAANAAREATPEPLQPDPALPPTETAASAIPPSGPAGPQTPTFTPALRLPAAGESRMLGMFESVECRENFVVLRIVNEGGSLRLGASGFDTVDFISYRADAPTSVNCGAVPRPMRVLANYRPIAATSPDSGLDGTAVAIELIPDGYVPR